MTNIQTSVSKKNRSEIQCLRGVAICAVLGFHLFPKYVPQGYLGVDVFFVLSGYLMTMLLKFSSNKKLSITVIFDFYRRRLKRLMPAYLNAILLTMVIASFILTKIDYQLLQKDGLLAIVFGTNFEGLIKHQDYFQLVATKKFLLHTWSLSVEVQYYLVAPFVLAWIVASKHPIYMSIILSIMSWGFHAVTMTNDSLSFYSTPARLWQFLFGTLVYHVEQKNEFISTNSMDTESEILLSSEKELTSPLTVKSKTSNSNTRNQILAVIFLILICFMPSLSQFLIYKNAIRTTATVLAAYIVFLGPPNLPDCIFTRGVLYLGDISYSVYLIHWPLEVFMQYQYPNIETRYNLLIIIFIVSIIQYELMEKKLLKTSHWNVFYACIFLYALIIPFCTFLDGSEKIQTDKDTEAAVALNEVYATCVIPSDCYYQPEIMKYYPKTKRPSGVYHCVYEGNGTLTFFVVGNSFAMRQLQIIRKILGDRFKKLYFMARQSCVIFEHLNTGKGPEFMCEELIGKTEVFMREVRPDVTFIIQGDFQGPEAEKAPSYKSVKNESLVLGIKHFIDIFSQYTRKLIVVEPHGRMYHNPAQKMAQLLKTGQSLDNYYLPEQDYKDSQMYTWWRHLAAMEGCQNCMTLNQTGVLCHEDTQRCDTFDKETKVSLYCDASHLSIAGMERVRPLYEETFDKVFSELGG